MMTVIYKCLILLLLISHGVRADFVYHDNATTSGGELNVSFPIANLKNSGHDSPADLENAGLANQSYATSSAAVFPVNVTLDFNTAVNLTKFYLWNHSNNSNGTAITAGVKDFTLTFYSGIGGTGSQIGAVFSSTATAAPAAGTYAAQTFNFASTYHSVRSVKLAIINRISGSGFAALREIGFERIPATFIYHNSATANGGLFSNTYPVLNLKNGGYSSPNATESADANAAYLSYATLNPPAGGYPVTIKLEFDSPAALHAFHLWNHSAAGSATAPDQGVNAFTLTFYDAPGGTGNQVGAVFNTTAAKAPATGNYSAETFTFGAPYVGVRSVVLTANNHAANTGFAAMREIGFTGIITPLPAPTPEKVIVYLIGGQSNADGYGTTDQLSVALQTPQPDIDFHHGNGGGLSPLAANQWIRLQPGSGSMGGNTGGFGPELNFGIGIHQALGSQNARIAIIKHTRGSTSLHTSWFPGGNATTAGDGPEYQAFQSTVNSALASLAIRYPAATIQLEGMLWHQGEDDVNTIANANAYQANLTNFIADIRATYGSGLKFGIAQLSDNQTSLNASRLATVKAAQAAVANASPLNYLVVTDDVPLVGTIHFGTSGNLTIGSRFAAGMQRVPITDPGGNGLDDAWEETHWGAGNAGQDANDDEDHDGLSNLKEFLWLTNPRASNVISPAFQISPALSITWPSSPSRRYMIEASSDLNTWQRLDSFIPGAAGASTSYTLPATTHRFFRVGAHR